MRPRIHPPKRCASLIFVLRVVPAQRRPGRSNRPKIDSIIYSLGFGNRESRVDFFALSIPILVYNSCFRPIQRASWGDRKSRHENMSYSLGLESKGRKNRLEFLDFQTLSYKYRNQFRSIFSLHAPLGWKHPEHEEGSRDTLTRRSFPNLYLHPRTH